MHAWPHLAVLLLVACSCRTERDAPPAAGPSSSPVPPAAVGAQLSPSKECHHPASAFSKIRLKRDECYGFCPAYTVEVHPDGSVVYQGDAYVRVRGPAHWTIPKAAADALFDMAACANPAQWKSEYVFGVTDNPTATLTVDLDVVGHAVVVRDYPPCHTEGDPTPAAICQLEEAIDEKAGTAAYVQCVGADGGTTYCR